MTNLDKDIRMAEKLGYGVHYGAYKVDYPCTRKQESAESLNPVEMIACKHCGTLFPRVSGFRKLYCNDDCRVQHASAVEKARTAERRRRNG